MPSYKEEERIYHKGFRDGYRAGYEDAQTPSFTRYKSPADIPQRKPRKRRKSPKQKLLEDMTNKKWKTYKGKKTWIQIRAQVSRSQAYKKKARRL